MNVLVACEESQTVCLAFRKKGHNAYSCDIIDCSGGHPEYHIKRDVLEVMKGGTFKTQDGGEVTIGKWDLMIAHPPCTFLSSSGASWYYHPEDKGLPKLTPTNIVGEGEIAITKSGKKMSKWYYDAISLPKEERQKLRSKTFQGIADAMADQWG